MVKYYSTVYSLPGTLGDKPVWEFEQWRVKPVKTGHSAAVFAQEHLKNGLPLQNKSLGLHSTCPSNPTCSTRCDTGRIKVATRIYFMEGGGGGGGVTGNLLKGCQLSDLHVRPAEKLGRERILLPFASKQMHAHVFAAGKQEHNVSSGSSSFILIDDCKKTLWATSYLWAFSPSTGQ